MPLPAVGAILGKIAAAGKAVAGKVAAGAAAKGVAAKGAAAAGGVATAGKTAGLAARAAATASLVKEVAVDIPSNIHSASVLSDAAQGANNAREYTRMLGPQQAAQQLPSDLPMGRKAPKGGPQDKSGLWQAPPDPSRRVLPPAAPAHPRVPEIPTGGPPASTGGSRPRGFFENVGERFSQWRQARAAQAAAPAQLKMPSTRIPRGADFKEKLQKVAKNLSETDPIRSNAPSLPTAQDDQGEQERKAAAAQHGEGGIKKVLLGLAVMGVALPVALHKAIQGIEQWTSGLMESYRPMERLNAAFATTFAKLERQQLVLTGRTAMATSGTGAMLGKELMGLREDMQPLREAGTQIRNILQIGLVYYARMATGMLTKIAGKLGLLEFLKQIDEQLRAENAAPGVAWLGMLKDMHQGNWDRPKNKRPGGGP